MRGSGSTARRPRRPRAPRRSRTLRTGSPGAPDRSARPHAVTTDADGTAWFTEWGANRVGSVASDGTVVVHDLPPPASEPHGITLGPDGALWAALETGALARIEPTTTRTTITSKNTEQRNAS